MGKHKERANAWENETVPDPIAEATKKAKEAEKAAEDSTPAVVTADEEFGGGGLLGAIKKSAAKKKKGKGGKNAKEEEPIPEPAVEASPEPEAEEKESKAPVAVTEISEDEFGPVKKGKKGKKGKGGAAPAPAPPPQKEAEDQDEGEGKDEDEDKDEEDDKDEQDRTGRVKTKKEKEKEKKERQKQKKKEQAAKKKAGAAEPAKVGEAKEAPKAAEKDAPAAETAGGKGKKKLPAALALLQKQQEERRRLEEEQRRFEEEERLRIEEEERLLAEEERKKEELKARKKEKEREKKEQLKREGKYLTKAQKEAQQKAQLRLQQMREAGIIVEGLDNADAATKKPVYDKKKKKGGDKKDQKAKEEEEEKKKEAERLEVEKKVKEEEERKKKEEEEAAAAKAAQEAEAAALKKEAEDVLDDWEAAVDEDGNIKESWDMETDEEDEDEKKEAKEEVKKEEKGQKPANGGAKAAPAGRKQVQEDSEEDSDEDSDEEDISTAKRQAAQRKEEAAARRQRQIKEAKAAASTDNLRSPICCILGHVDTGKTKLLDKIRQTNVQEGEAGGITQQIGATYFPMEAIKQKTQVVNQDGKMEYKVPGLLVIDTPGHESFTNLRSRGSSLCNIAILVVDIMHGLEPQTIESIQLLRDRKTPFIVALNKIDRLYGWNPIPDNGFKESLAKQKKSVQTEFRDRLDKTILAFQEQGLNSALFYENKNMGKNISLVPTSAHSGEGIPDMLKLLVTLTQQRMAEKLMYLSELECTVLEVKVIEGLGTTIDVILSNGVLREGDRIVLCGLNGAISTNVRALLTPQPLKELRIKSQYVHNKEVKAALGVKIAANDLEHAIAGSRLMVVSPDDDEEDLEEEVMSDLEQLLGKVSTTGKGVAVQASTLGSLEALLEFLRVSKIPVSTISIGPVYKRDVMRAGTMLEKNKEFAVMLCFDVKIDKDAQQYAEEVGVKIFTANIIYHLFDAFTAYQKEMLELKRKETADQAVFPCVLSPVAVFNKRDPIIIGVDVIEGSLRIGTPIAAVKKNPLTGEMEPVLLGRVTSMHLNQKAVPLVKKGQPSVAVKIEGANQPLYGRHLEEKDTLYSHISRRTIDTLKNHFREEVAKEDWQLLINLKKVFNVT